MREFKAGDVVRITDNGAAVGHCYFRVGSLCMLTDINHHSLGAWEGQFREAFTQQLPNGDTVTHAAPAENTRTWWVGGRYGEPISGQPYAFELVIPAEQVEGYKRV